MRALVPANLLLIIVMGLFYNTLSFLLVSPPAFPVSPCCTSHPAGHKMAFPGSAMPGPGSPKPLNPAGLFGLLPYLHHQGLSGGLGLITVGSQPSSSVVPGSQSAPSAPLGCFSALCSILDLAHLPGWKEIKY